MADLIDRSALGIGRANPLVFDKPEYAKGWNSAVEIIEKAPAVDAVVLPCKIGDTVYMPIAKWRIYTGYVADICDGFYIGRDGVLQIKVKNDEGNHSTYGVLGISAFLTKEEAEKAIGERRENEAD